MKFKLYKKQFLSVILFLGLSSCFVQNDREDIPPNILNEEKFTKVILDFALAESASNINIQNVPVIKIDSTYAFNPLKENKVSKAEYDSAVLFYSKHPAIYKKIYENVLASLSKMQVKKDTLKPVLDSK